jgi:hypothetical protein
MSSLSRTSEECRPPLDPPTLRRLCAILLGWKLVRGVLVWGVIVDALRPPADWRESDEREVVVGVELMVCCCSPCVVEALCVVDALRLVLWVCPAGWLAVVDDGWLELELDGVSLMLLDAGVVLSFEVFGVLMIFPFSSHTPAALQLP